MEKYDGLYVKNSGSFKHVVGCSTYYRRNGTGIRGQWKQMGVGLKPHDRFRCILQQHIGWRELHSQILP